MDAKRAALAALFYCCGASMPAAGRMADGPCRKQEPAEKHDEAKIRFDVEPRRIAGPLSAWVEVQF
jgi:hypothetical protein